jgi:ABC-type multidrug transport system fused ATPase/permease subunit
MLRPSWGWIAIAVVLLLLSLPAELFPGLAWMYATDKLLLTPHSGSAPVSWFVLLINSWLGTLFSFNGLITNRIHLLFSVTVWMIVIYLLAESFGTISAYIMSIVAQKFTRTVRNDVYHKLQSQSLGYLQRQRLGDLMSRAMSDVDELQSFLVNSIDQIVGDGLQWVVTVVLVMLLSWKVSVASLAPLLVVYVLLRIFNKKVAPIYKAAREKAGDVSTRLQENLAGVVVIKIFGRETEEARRFREATDNYYDQQVKAIRARSTFFPVSRAVGFLSNPLMLGVGVYSILTGGSFTVGMLLVFRAYWWRLFGPINTLARINDMIQRAIAAARRVFEVLDAPDELPDAPDAKQIDHPRGDIELRHVDFSYGAELRGVGGSPVLESRGPAAHLTVLHDISLLIGAGQTVALCGPSGSGKSTILNLLLRFYDPTQGQVTLDGIDLRSIQRESLRRHFALVQQESFLFNDSIVDNIRYGHAEATMDQVISAAKAANAHEFISRLPNGYDTIVGERGIRMSGGQKQRISIARAFLANPKILLLDEPTSSVEPDSEAAIIAALDRLMTGRTTVVTSHRPSLISQADVVYLIEEGRVTDFGPPEELRTRSAWFNRFLSGDSSYRSEAQSAVAGDRF